MSKFEEIFLLNLFRNRPLKTTAKRPRSRPTRRLRPRRPKRSGNVGAGERSGEGAPGEDEKQIAEERNRFRGEEPNVRRVLHLVEGWSP